VEYNTSTNPTFEGAVRDTSGRGNDGVFVGGASYDATEKALVFPGTIGNYLRTGALNTFVGNQAFTFSGWFRRTNTSTVRQDWFYLGKPGTAYGSAFSIFTSGNSTYAYGFGNDIFSTTNQIPDESWYHVMITFVGGIPNTTNKKVYLNGADITSAFTSSATHTQNFQPDSPLVLGNGADLSYPSPVNISNFKLYDVALTAEEVKTLYDMGRNGSVANPQPLHIAAPLYSPGTIVQVEQSLKTDTFSTTGLSSHPVSPGNDVPGLAVTIHPKFANSKILVSYTVSTGAYGRAYLRIQRKQGGSTTTIAPSVGVPNSTDGKCTTSHSGSNDSSVDSQSFEYYDTIGGTEPITYQIQAWTYHSVYYIYINRAHVDGNGSSDGTYWARTLSSITAKEVCQ
jgi:hypothetical protein